MMVRPVPFFLLFLVLLFTACNPVTPRPAVKIQPESATVEVGKTFKFTATETATWISSNTTVATIDNSGLATGKAPGKTTLTATTTDGRKATAQLEVKSSITITPPGGQLAPGKTLQLNASESVTWISSNTTVATISATGLVTAKALGKTTITATATATDGRKATVEIEVKAAPDLAITPAGGVLTPNKTLQLTANDTVTWTSSNTTVATVDNTGKVTAKALGKTTITATAADGRKATVEIEVKVAPAITVMGGAIQVGRTSQLVASEPVVGWSSSDTSVATIDNTGLLTGVKVGASFITATTADGRQAILPIEVKTALVITRDDSRTFLYAGDTQQYRASEPVTSWSSSDTSIFTVDATGKVTALREGTATLTAQTAEPKIATVTITVKTRLAISPVSTTLEVGNTRQLNANLPVTWSSNSNAVTVNASGLVTAVAIGQATITATSADGQTATVTLNVISSTFSSAQITAFGHTSCALNAAGEATCWGKNDVGQMGAGFISPAGPPTPVTGNLKFSSLMGTSETFICGLSTTKDIYCWGDGLTTPTIPTGLSAGMNVVSLIDTSNLARTLVCGLNAAGQVICNESYMGLNGMTVTAVAFGAQSILEEDPPHSICVLAPSGTAMCWGSPMSLFPSTPEPVTGNLNFTEIGAGHHHFCGLTTSQKVYCWSGNMTPSPILPDLNFQDLIPTGSGRICAFATNNRAYCWTKNSEPQVVKDANNTEIVFASIIGETGLPCGITATQETYCGGNKVATDVPLTAVSAGNSHVCAIRTDQKVVCWGNNEFEQLGVAARNSSVGGVSLTVPHRNIQDFKAFSLKRKLSCGIGLDDRGYCWGESPVQGLPTAVPENKSVISIAAGFVHTNSTYYACWVTVDHTAQCYGDNSRGQFGNGGINLTGPTVGNNWASLVAGYRAHTCGLTTDQKAYCWGEKGDHLGIAAIPDPVAAVPYPVQGGHTFTSLSTAENHTCGVTPEHTIYCWGSNSEGQLGNGTLTSTAVPQLVFGDLQFSTVTTGQSFTCALTLDQKAYCWGANFEGQLGDGTQFRSIVPKAVNTALQFTSISAGNGLSSLSGPDHGYVCAVATDQKVYCWGKNLGGRFGNGTMTSVHLTPTPAVGPVLFKTVVAGVFHTCGISMDNKSYCWGANSDNQLGVLSLQSSSTPILVPQP
ncbi:Ig-like domain-containing protein [Deinococcus cellulosilyticus]|uniref:BIG2 domain-containing protein n=1 Tax=Deinococcus cellulosilyticus (strain DSM 18568 / NBRC 106333 / KACC 11606 / 5516J-15) TaxID=1223518 RepID=A0A511N5D5_DEIC1|nr:Ig-like domain-containing protein [Deinococcus cellulosilyticus]GEM47631.1 hypothetical protein DC3_32660 [Deinococcus cellulosilyticus NBRC 106333 = KACC 11606]